METSGTPTEEMAALVTQQDIEKLYESVEEAHKSFEAMIAEVNTSTEDLKPGRGTGRHIACFVLDATEAKDGGKP